MKFSHIVVTLAVGLSFLACGGGGGSSSQTSEEHCEPLTQASTLVAPTSMSEEWSVGVVGGVNVINSVATAYDQERDVVYFTNKGGLEVGKFSADGNRTSPKNVGSWITGFDRALALDVFDDKLYVVEDYRVTVFDINELNATNTRDAGDAYIDTVEANVLEDIAVDTTGAIYLSELGYSYLLKIPANTPYGNVSLVRDFDVTFGLEEIQGLYNADCNLVISGADPYLRKLIQGQSAEILVNHMSNMDPVHLTSVDLYNLDENGNRTYVVADNASEIKVVYDHNKTIRSLSGGNLGSTSIGKISFKRDTNLVFIPGRNYNLLSAYKLQ